MIEKKNFLKLFFLMFFLTGFKSIDYNIISKNIDDRKYYFTLPENFCVLTNNNEVLELVKCNELELQKEGELSYFSDIITIAVNKDNADFQRITDKAFANLRRYAFNKVAKEKKEKYLFNNYYPIKNKTNSYIIKNNFIYNRIGFDENDNKYIVYETQVYLNKRCFFINWIQYLTKNEQLLKKEKFLEFVEKNKNSNKLEDNLFDIAGNKILVSKPKFDNFENFTNVREINKVGFHGIFLNLFKNAKEQYTKIFKVSLVNNINPNAEIFDILFEKSQSIKDKTIYNYKDIKYIKISESKSTMFISYIKLSNNIFAIINLEVLSKIDDDSKYLEDLFRYINQLINDNL